jgi:hypothetical protein
LVKGGVEIFRGKQMAKDKAQFVFEIFGKRLGMWDSGHSDGNNDVIVGPNHDGDNDTR